MDVSKTELNELQREAAESVLRNDFVFARTFLKCLRKYKDRYGVERNVRVPIPDYDVVKNEKRELLTRDGLPVSILTAAYRRCENSES